MFNVDLPDIETSMRRPLTLAENFAVRQWANEAAILIRGRLGDLSLLDQETLQMVIRWAVVELLKHPDAVTEVTTSVDDATSTRKYERSAGHVVIDDAWWDLLTPGTKGDGQAFSIRPHFASDHVVSRHERYRRAW